MGYLQRRLFFSLVSVMATISFCISTNDEPLQLNDDVLGLVVFKLELQDPYLHLSSWNEDDSSPCSWSYIECNPVTNRVTELSLDGLNLSGKIGRGLEKLLTLRKLSLSFNNFSGEISPELSLLPNLESLNLSHNSLTGQIPASLSSNMNSMKFLDFSHNSLSGPLHENLFDNCFSLRFISLTGNRLDGPIPNSLFKCTSLNGLNLSNNHFSGDPDFATAFRSLDRLRTLDLSNNLLSGSVPNGISNLHNIKELCLQSNSFSGELPSDIGMCPHLYKLDLSNNLFTGAMPSSIKWLTSLTDFNLENNMITGDFPSWIGDLKLLSYLSLSNNQLTGEIPASLTYCNNLLVLRLRGNRFNGSIPDGLFGLSLEEIDFSGNGFTGRIQPGANRLYDSLRSLDLSRNRFTGDIPVEMGLFSNLRYLNLSWNNLTSRMLPEFGYFQNLTVLDLRNSGLYGSIPVDLCDSGELGILQLDGNDLTGPIPDEIGNCSSLYLLSLSRNKLNGSIPKSISQLNRLKILNLEFNQLNGEIPLELGKLENLLAVNISYNRLTGRLPMEGIFPTLDKSSLQGNLGLCSPLLQGPCKMNVPKPLVLDPYAYINPITNGNQTRVRGIDQHRRFLSVSAIVAISAALLIAVGVLVISLANVSARRRLAFVENALESVCSSSLSRSGPTPMVGKLVLFDSKLANDPLDGSDYTLLNKTNEIGSGVFGTVYKASMGKEKQMVAIKKLVTSNIIQYPEDFDRELRILAKAKHPNLTEIKGYYWTPHLQLIVSDYAQNGSLQARLHERRSLSSSSSSSSSPLTWPDRFKIVTGIAKGLAHLHHSFRPPIIHYSLKPTNILLDENLNPKLSDFGLARLLKRLDKHVMSNRFENSLGYAAPELACRSLRVNEKCDIYGFGVIILELVTGRRAVEYEEESVLILSDEIRVLIEEGNVLDCVDLEMGEYPEEEVLPVLKLGLVCTSQIPSSRPSMAEVVQILQVIKTPVPQRMEIF